MTWGLVADLHLLIPWLTRHDSSENLKTILFKGRSFSSLDRNQILLIVVIVIFRI
jgi:hypothetical protein